MTFEPITTPEDLEALIGPRLKRERARIERERSEQQQRRLEAARREGERLALTTAAPRLRAATARALAAVRFHDPHDVVRLLDLDAVAVDEEGQVDEQAIAAQLDELAEAKPYLLKP